MSSEGELGRTNFIAAHGLRTPEQAEAALRAVQVAKEKGIQTIRLSFADQHGILRGKTIVVDFLEAALKNGCGMTSTLLLKDTSHRTVYPVWRSGGGLGQADLTGGSDFVLVPDPTTFRILPWTAQSAWMLGDCYFQNGLPVPFSTRQICEASLRRLENRGYRYLAGLELEFYVFKLLDPKLDARDCGQPATPPEVRMLAHGYQYLTETRFDELEPVLDLLRGSLLQLGLPIRTMECEMGPSQCELTFSAVEGLKAADNVMLARSAIKQICRRSGYHATFMCRPGLANMASSGWHLHQSLTDKSTGKNAFMSSEDDQLLAPTGRQYLAGLLEHARAACIFATPTINGYKRYRPYSLAPNRIVWGRENRGAMIRVIGGPHDPITHLENRQGEPAANPYLYFSSQIDSGLDGIERGLAPPESVDTPYDSGGDALPKHLVAAIAELRGSELFRKTFGDQFIDYFATIKEAEVNRFLSDEVTDWEHREYFELF